MKVLVPIPQSDFDPTEVAVSWKIIKEHGHKVIFSTPSGERGHADNRMLTGQGLSIWKRILIADSNALNAYKEMESSVEFLNPIKWEEINSDEYDGLILPGGHAKGMIQFLESQKLQSVVCNFFDKERPVGAVCHGVVLAARSKRKDGKSVLFDKRTTALRKDQEVIAWLMTCLWLGDYYRTYSEYVEDEIKRNLRSPKQFDAGPMAIARDSKESLSGFCVVDGNYISARWPGDVHTFATKFCGLLQEG